MRLFLTAASLLALSAAPALAGEARSFDIWQSTEGGRSVIAIAAVGDKAPFAAAAGAEKTALDLLPADEASLAIADFRGRTEKTIETSEVIADQSGAESKGGAKVVEIEKKVEKAADHGDHGKAHGDHASHSPEQHAAAMAEGDAAPHKIVLIKQTAEGEKAEKKEVRRVIKLSDTEKMTDARLAELIEQAKADLAAEGGEVWVEKGVLAADDADAMLLASAKGSKVFVVENSKEGASSRFVAISGADAAWVKTFIEKAEGLDASEKSEMSAALGL